MSQFVCARITSMAGIDIGLFEFDRHNALYFFVMNADEQIYLRYGGRDSASATTYLDLRSLELALEQGLAAHEKNKAAGRSKKVRPARRYPRDDELLWRRTVGRRRCVECHLIDDYRVQQLESAGKLDKLKSMYRSPDIKTIGIYLDVPRGLVVGRVKGAAADAGMRKADRIVEIGGQPVLTFGDLQFQYDLTPRDAKQIQLTVARTAESGKPEQRKRLKLDLPHQWWRTDLGYRYWSIEPLVYYRSRPLTEAEKKKYGFPVKGFASRVTGVHPQANRFGIHDLRVGDITYSVGGVQTDAVADSTDLFVKLRKRSGDRVKVGVLRNGKKLDIHIQTRRYRFRK